MDETPRILEAVAAYKEQIYGKLLELLPRRLARLSNGELDSLSHDELILRVYMQGVAEALDALDIEELLRVAAQSPTPNSLLA